MVVLLLSKAWKAPHQPRVGPVLHRLRVWRARGTTYMVLTAEYNVRACYRREFQVVCLSNIQTRGFVYLPQVPPSLHPTRIAMVKEASRMPRLMEVRTVA